MENDTKQYLCYHFFLLFFYWAERLNVVNDRLIWSRVWVPSPFGSSLNN